MCSDFLAMCADDPVCQSCFDGKDQGALENCILDQNLRDGCDAIVFGACCIDEQSSQDCLGSDIFKSLVLCEAKRDLNKDCGPLICPTELAEDICLASLEDQYAVCQGDPVCSECMMGWDVEDHVDCIDGRWYLEPCTFGELEACCIDQLVPSLDCMANDAFQTLYRCREKEPVGLEYCSGPWTCSASGGTDSTPAPTPPPAGKILISLVVCIHTYSAGKGVNYCGLVFILTSFNKRANVAAWRVVWGIPVAFQTSTPSPFLMSHMIFI